MPEQNAASPTPGSLPSALKTLAAHPIYRRDTARWSALRARHWLLLVIAVVGLVTAACGLPLGLYLPISPARVPVHTWSPAATVAVFGLFVGQELIKGLLVLGAALLAGAALGAERIDQAGDLLRLTPLSSRSIMLARLGAILRILLIPLIVVITIRLAFVLVVGPDFLEQQFSMMASMPSLSAFARFQRQPIGPLLRTVGIEAYHLLHAALWRLDVLHLKGHLWPLWVAYYGVQPLLDAALFAAAGMAAASKARTPTQGILRALMLALGLVGIGYFAERAVSLGLSALWMISTRLNPLVYLRPPWDFGGGISPPGLVNSLWTAGLPVVTIGFLEWGLFEILLPLTLALKIGLVWVFVRAASRRMTAR